MLKRWAAWPRGNRWLAGIGAVVLGLAIVWALFVPIADWLAHHDVGSVRGPLHETALDNARGRLLTLGAGLLAAGALIFTGRNFLLSREGQVTDRYTKAIEQLGSDKLDVRIGGIYALERIAHDSVRDHSTVMEVLTAFIREHSHEPWPPPDDPASRDRGRSTRPDVRAALTAVLRRNAERDIRPIDLAGANLAHTNLGHAALDGANLAFANLTRANLTRANLNGASLAFANLNGSVFWHTNLRGACLLGADLTALFTYADLTGAALANADLTDAELTGARFTDANLLGVRWPEGTPVPDGWKLDSSGRLRAAGADAETAEAN